MRNEYNSIIFIGRFQPVHNAHVAMIRYALDKADKVIVVIGSANQPRTPKNPFTIAERESMLRSALSDVSPGRIIIRSIEDNTYNNQAWVVALGKEVGPFIHGKVGIIGHLKDDSSFYLKMFPQWQFIDRPQIEPLHASDLRRLYLSRTTNLNFFKGVAPESTINFLNGFMALPEYARLCIEQEFINDYKRQYASSPYPPTFVTTDAVVIQSGHVLMIRRRAEPGKGLYALPGGFLNADTDKSIEDCMIRELYEETNIKVPEKVLRGNIKQTHVFDSIGRSSRGRTITHAFYIVLSDGEWNLPKVRGGDDADPEGTGWQALSTLDRSQCFEDHYDIIRYRLG